MSTAQACFNSTMEHVPQVATWVNNKQATQDMNGKAVMPQTAMNGVRFKSALQKKASGIMPADTLMSC